MLLLYYLLKSSLIAVCLPYTKLFSANRIRKTSRHFNEFTRPIDFKGNEDVSEAEKGIQLARDLKSQTSWAFDLF